MNTRASAYRSDSQQRGDYAETPSTRGAAEKKARLTSVAALQAAEETKCNKCDQNFITNTVFATLTPVDESSDTNTYLNLAPRYVLDGGFLCLPCLRLYNRFGLMIYFNADYKEYTPDFMKWNMVKLYYPQITKERVRGGTKTVISPGAGTARYHRKHVDIFYDILGCTAERLCSAPYNPRVMLAFAYAWDTARQVIRSEGDDTRFPASESDRDFLLQLTTYTASLPRSLKDASVASKVDHLQKQLDPRVLVWIQQSCAMTRDQNRQLSPRFLSMAASMVSQTCFPEDKMSPVDVGIVRTTLTREFLNRAARHLGRLNLRGFTDKGKLVRHVIKRFQKESLNVLRTLCFLCDLVEKYQTTLKEESGVNKITIGSLEALHNSLVQVEDLRTLLGLNGLVHLTSEDVAEMFLEASEAKDGQVVSAAVLDLSPQATRRHSTLDRIIAANRAAGLEQKRETTSLKFLLQAKKREAGQADFQKALFLAPLLDTEVFSALVSDLPRDGERDAIRSLREEIECVEKQSPPKSLQLYRDNVRISGHSQGEGIHTFRLSLIEILAQDPGVSLLEWLLLARAFPYGVKKFRRLVWRLAPPNSAVLSQLGIDQSHTDHDRSNAPRTLKQYNFKVNINYQPCDEETAEDSKREENCYVSLEEATRRVAEHRLALEAADRKLQEQRKQECPVCFEKLHERPHFRLPCSTPPRAPHMLCAECMVCLMNPKRCTLCRKSFDPEQLRVINRLARGAEVKIQGLMQNTKYNGERARVIRYHATKGRYEVSLIESPETKLLVRSTNLKAA